MDIKTTWILKIDRCQKWKGKQPLAAEKKRVLVINTEREGRRMNAGQRDLR